MVKIPVPAGCFLEKCILLGSPQGRKRWKNAKGKLFFEWDSLHGEVEVYNKRGKHLGAMDPITQIYVKDAVEGRKIDV